MAFDGFVIAALTKELRETLLGGRVSKISMPEKDELLMVISNNSTNYRLLLSADPSLPLIYLTDDNKQSPANAPTFCMLLRRYIGSGRIIDIYQTGMERIITFEIQHLDDLDNICVKKLIIELMGKYSNIIFTDSDDKIIDSIKRVPSFISSLREVLPGRYYYLPDELRKRNPLEAESICCEADELCQTYEGISPVMASEIEYNAKDSDLNISFMKTMSMVKSGEFNPVLIERRDKPVDFAAFKLNSFEAAEYRQMPYTSISRLLEDFYESRESYNRMRQRTAELRKITSTALERASKKLNLQEKQLRDCTQKDKYKVYGDLINTYGYSLSGGEKQLVCENYYDDNKEIHIPLDEHKSASENAVRYYDKYAKMRRTEEALTVETVRTRLAVEQLDSILTALDISVNESDLNQIKEELVQSGYIKKTAAKKNGFKLPVSKPLHYVSPDGFDIYVGKNNIQNDELTFSFATGNDIWFHTKGVPGSHVIVKLPDGKDDAPDTTYETAAAIAAYYSRNSQADKVEVDYTRRKNLKRVNGGAPGFVIYHTNYSMLVKPGLAELKSI